MKILAVGDSFTYGSELPDIPTTGKVWVNRPPASLFAYPAVLATQLGAKVTNLSMPDGSNSRIFRAVLNESIKNTYDLIICGWTEISRLDLQLHGVDFPANNSPFTTNNIPWMKDYYKSHYNDDHAYATWLPQIIALQNHFKLHNQRYLFLNMQGIDSIDAKFNHLLKEIDTKYYPGWHQQGMTDWMGDCPKGPGGHPLELGHQRIAEHVKKHIRNLGWLP